MHTQPNDENLQGKLLGHRIEIAKHIGWELSTLKETTLKLRDQELQ
jgi:hypothetical protein